MKIGVRTNLPLKQQLLRQENELNYDNPAARLLALLTEGKMCLPGTSCREVWNDLLNANGDASLLMSRLGKVMELSRETVLALEAAFPDQGNTWSHWEAQVNTAFMVQNLHATWESFINHIDTHSITYLRMSAALLQTRMTTKLIANDELSTLRTTLDQILVDVFATDQPEEVKRYLVRSLRKLINSIDEYRLTGTLPMLDTIESSLGHAAVDKAYKSFLTDTEVGKKLLDTLASMANVVTVSVGIPQLSQAITLLAR
jgi:hypothetical protein